MLIAVVILAVITACLIVSNIVLAVVAVRAGRAAQSARRGVSDVRVDLFKIGTTAHEAKGIAEAVSKGLLDQIRDHGNLSRKIDNMSDRAYLTGRGA